MDGFLTTAPLLAPRTSSSELSIFLPLRAPPLGCISTLPNPAFGVAMQKLPIPTLWREAFLEPKRMGMISLGHQSETFRFPAKSLRNGFLRLLPFSIFSPPYTTLTSLSTFFASASLFLSSLTAFAHAIPPSFSPLTNTLTTYNTILLAFLLANPWMTMRAARHLSLSSSAALDSGLLRITARLHSSPPSINHAPFSTH